MRRFSIICFFLFAGLNLFAQVHKRFLDKNDKYISDSVKAKAYILYQKESDSLYSAVKLDMRNIPIFKGAFFDENLTVPIGKFFYYISVINQKSVDKHQLAIDTTLAIRETGYFIDGRKEGAWVVYFSNGVKAIVENYERNELNGLYQEFDSHGKIYREGNYLNGGKEGDWYTYWGDSTLMDHRYYAHGLDMFYEQYRITDQVLNARPGFNFSGYVTRYLKKIGLPPSHGVVIVTFTITKDGKLVKPELKAGVNVILDEAIIEAMLKSPAWVPAKKHKKPIEQTTTLGLEYDTKD